MRALHITRVTMERAIARMQASKTDRKKKETVPSPYHPSFQLQCLRKVVRNEDTTESLQ